MAKANKRKLNANATEQNKQSKTEGRNKANGVQEKSKKMKKNVGTKNQNKPNIKKEVGQPKPSKLQMFSGTSKMESSDKDKLKKLNIKQENLGSKGPIAKKIAPTKKPKQEKPTAEKNVKGDNRHKRRRSVSQKDKRKTARQGIAKLKQRAIAGDQDAIKEVRNKLNKLRSLPKVGSNGKRLIKIFGRLIKKLDSSTPNVNGNAVKKINVKQEKIENSKNKTVNQNKKKVQVPQKQVQLSPKQVVSVKIEKKEEGDDYIGLGDDTSENSIEDENEQDSDENGTEESSDADEESDDEEGSSDDEEEGGSEDKVLKSNIKKAIQTQIVKKTDKQDSNKVKARYVVFVGNLPYTTKKEEIAEHFKKVGQITDIRIPLKKDSNKPQGFAYVELSNEESYQKALSLNHTFIDGRRINVHYTQGGKKKSEKQKNEIKAKNFKLKGMQKQGLLAGSVKANQKRSVRRAKNKQQNA